MLQSIDSTWQERQNAYKEQPSGHAIQAELATSTKTTQYSAANTHLSTPFIPLQEVSSSARIPVPLAPSKIHSSLYRKNQDQVQHDRPYSFQEYISQIETAKPIQEMTTTSSTTPSSTWLTPSTPSAFKFDDSGLSIDMGDIKFDMMRINATSCQFRSSSEKDGIKYLQSLAEPLMDTTDNEESLRVLENDLKGSVPDVPIEAVVDFSFEDEYSGFPKVDDDLFQLGKVTCHQEASNASSDLFAMNEIDTSPTYHLSRHHTSDILQAPLTFSSFQQCGDTLLNGSLDQDVAGLGLIVAADDHGHDQVTTAGMEKTSEYFDSSFSSNDEPNTSSLTCFSSICSKEASISHISADSNSSRWVHGKDTPPTSPSAPNLGPRSKSLAGTAQLNVPGFDDIMQRPRMNPRSNSAFEWSSAWPKAASNTQMHHSLSQSYEPIQHLSPFIDVDKEFRRPTSSVSLDHKDPQDKKRSKRHSRLYTANSPLLGNTTTSDTPWSRSSLGSITTHKNYCQSDIGPSRSRNTMISESTDQSRKVKRLSASLASNYEARRIHQEKQDQYEQVSGALDTLKKFLSQSEGIMTFHDKRLNRPTSLRDLTANHQSPMLILAEQVSSLLHTPSHQDPLSHNGEATAQSPPSPGTTEAEHIAALDDLAKRIRQMKYDDEMQQQFVAS